MTSTYNNIRLKAFIGWDEIIPFIKKHYPQLKDEVFCSYVFWCIDNIHYIFDQVKSREDRENYISTIQYYLRKYYKSILTINKLAVKNKYVIALVTFNLKLLVLQFFMKTFLLKFTRLFETNNSSQ